MVQDFFHPQYVCTVWVIQNNGNDNSANNASDGDHSSVNNGNDNHNNAKEYM